MEPLTTDQSPSQPGSTRNRWVLAGLAVALAACACPCALALIAGGAWVVSEVNRYDLTPTFVRISPTPPVPPFPTPAPPLIFSRTPTPFLPTITPARVLKIVSDLPMIGASVGQTQHIVNAIQMAFEEIGYQACGGQYTIVYESHDDASAALGKWDPEVVVANAQAYVADPSIVAVIGTFNSGAAKLMIPVLNPERLVMISPANTYPGLTKQVKGSPDEPDTYYPNGERNYARVTYPDDMQGTIGAQWAKDLGAQSVYLLDDGEIYGVSTADAFELTARELGLENLGHEQIDPQAPNYTALASRLKRLKPDLIYFGGIYDNNAGQLIRDIREAGYAGLIMGPDGILTQAFVDAAGADAAEGVYATLGGPSVDHLPDRAAQWGKAYEARYGMNPDPYAFYGYAAAALLLDALDRVCASGGSPTDRAALRDAVFATENFESVLGTFSIQPNGDPTLLLTSGYQVHKGAFEFVTLLGGP